MKKITLSVISLFLVSVFLSGCFLFDPHRKDYDAANDLFDNGEFKAAAEAFAELVEYDYKDAQEKEKQSLYAYAEECFANKNFDEAINTFASIDGYSNSAWKKREVENEVVYISAVEYMDNEEYEQAKEIFESLSGYKNSRELIESIRGIFYDKALSYADSFMYEKAIETFNIIPGYKDAAEQVEFCNKKIKYNKALSDYTNKRYDSAYSVFTELKDFQDSADYVKHIDDYYKYTNAVSDFNAGKSDSAYSVFAEFGDYEDSAKYVNYIDAGKAAKAKKYGEAAEKYFSVKNFLDSGGLCDENLYLYFDQQFGLGNKDMSKLPLYRIYENGFYSGWRNRRINDLEKKIENTEGLAEYFDRTDTSTLTNITGAGIYINASNALYGADYIATSAKADVPIFFLADSLAKVRYVMNFSSSFKLVGYYTAATVTGRVQAYETTITVTIKDTVTGQKLFSKSYAAYPPMTASLNYTQLSYYSRYNFETKNIISGLSVYESDILPVLESLYK